MSMAQTGGALDNGGAVNDNYTHRGAGMTLRSEATHFEMVPHWIMDHPEITGNAIRLYLLLRRYGDKNGVSFPGRKRLADDLRIAINTLDVAKDLLVQIGALRVEERLIEGSREQSTNLYTVVWEGSKIDSPPTQKLHDPLPKNWVHPYPKIGEGTNTQLTTYPTNQDKNMFDQFWNAYPRKSGKKAAERAWMSATLKDSPEEIIIAARKYRDDPNRIDQYTKHPATWLNQGCWEDDPLPSREPVTKIEAKHEQRRNLIQWAINQDQQRGELEA